jgi:hypothetical protein
MKRCLQNYLKKIETNKTFKKIIAIATQNFYLKSSNV